MMLSSVLIFLTLDLALSSDLVGHLEPLGKQRPTEGHIEVLHDLPSPLEFYEKYVKPGKPVVFKDAAKPMPAFKEWTDEYLRTKYADLKFDIEEGKKENRSQRSFVFSMKDFIDKYKVKDIYMVHSIATEMRGDVHLLPTISCGGYINLLQDIVMWFSSGGTSSVLHSDGVDNINCLFSGTKELYFVDKKHSEFIDIDVPDGGYCNVNPAAVDLKKYPGFTKAPWWEAKMEAGDCLFIPVSWYHQVRSFDRNIAVNVWFTHPNQINETDCNGKSWKSHYVPLDKFQLKSNAGAKQMLALEVKGKKKLSKRDFAKFVAVNLQADHGQVNQIFKLIDKNDDKYITMEDINDLTDSDLKSVRQIMPMGYAEDESGEDEGDTWEPLGDDMPQRDVNDNQIDDGYEDEPEPGMDMNKDGAISGEEKKNKMEEKYRVEL
eukprot:gene9650-10638_t